MMQTSQKPAKHFSAPLPLMKKSSRFYDFRAELDLEMIHDDSTDKGSESMSPLCFSDSASIKSDFQETRNIFDEHELSQYGIPKV
jgi:hypothetical protein